MKEKENVLRLMHEERCLHCMYSNISLEFIRINIRFTPPWNSNADTLWIAFNFKLKYLHNVKSNISPRLWYFSECHLRIVIHCKLQYLQYANKNTTTPRMWYFSECHLRIAFHCKLKYFHNVKRNITPRLWYISECHFRMNCIAT